MTWLIRANKAIWFDKPEFSVRLAEGGTAEFPDVSTDHPELEYIQGAANAGLAVGNQDGTFTPDLALTREESIAIVGLDGGGVVRNSDSQYNNQQWIDKERISQRFISLFPSEEGSKDNINVQRTFGAIKSFNPPTLVTRAEAAICLTAFGDKRMLLN